MAKAKEDIRSLARSHTSTAIKVLAGIMNQGKAPPAARVAAASAILDRGWGKPKQEMNLDGKLGYVGVPVINVTIDDGKVPIPVSERDPLERATGNGQDFDATTD